MPQRLLLRPGVLRKLALGSGVKFESQLTSIRAALPSPTYPPASVTSPRLFSSTPPTLKTKYKGKASSIREATDEVEDSSSSVAKGEAEDPFDFSTLNEGISKVQEKLKDDLSKLRTGGRFNPEALENLRVNVQKGSKATERLGDLAQVLPKGGRSLMILVGENEHIKPIISAIQSSPTLNLQPQPDPHNSSQLNIPIPPPTKESRDLAISSANKVGESAQLGVRNARAAMQKRLRGMEVRKVVRPDDLKKAGKEMEKVVEKAVAEAKKMVEAARKVMEQV